jgi:hypothetical protein
MARPGEGCGAEQRRGDGAGAASGAAAQRWLVVRRRRPMRKQGELRWHGEAERRGATGVACEGAARAEARRGGARRRTANR